MKSGAKLPGGSPAAVLLVLLALCGCGQPDRPTAQTPTTSRSAQPVTGAGNALPQQIPANEQTVAAAPPPPAEKQAAEQVPQDEQQVKPETLLGPPAKTPESSPEIKPSTPAQPTLPAEQPEQSSEASSAEPPGFIREAEEELPFPFEIPAQWKRLSEKEEIWIDSQEKLVAVSGRICLTRGLLEMFACPKGTKEHESIVATKPWAMYIHQALLLAGINPGRTVQWEPEYKPAEGPRIDVEVWYFNDQKELIKRNAKEMVRLVSDGSPLKIDWVFGGSKFITDPDGRELYAANGGELICLSNFSSAMIDLPIPSTAEAGGLLFEANPDQIPPLNTPVLLVLKAQAAPSNAPQPSEPTGGDDKIK